MFRTDDINTGAASSFERVFISVCISEMSVSQRSLTALTRARACFTIAIAPLHRVHTHRSLPAQKHSHKHCSGTHTHTSYTRILRALRSLRFVPRSIYLFFIYLLTFIVPKTLDTRRRRRSLDPHSYSYTLQSIRINTERTHTHTSQAFAHTIRAALPLV